MRPLYIFDLDGTLASIEHRRHFLAANPPNWDQFSAHCRFDEAFPNVIATFLRLQESGADCWIWTGRSNIVATETAVWLAQHGIETDGPILMRDHGDHQPDTDLKAYWLSMMNNFDRNRLVAVFEDRTRVVEMWRKNGVTCFQVAKGDF